MSASPVQPLRIGTRASPLALRQAGEVAARLAVAHGVPAKGPDCPYEIVPMSTTGDRVMDRTLSDIGGKGLFTKEIEDALHDGRIDLAVHSLKDMPTVLPDGLTLSAYLPRADRRDALIGAPSLDAIPKGAVVGTASLRRQAQMLSLRPDLTIVPLRGNVGTRLSKLAEGGMAATLLAMAGLERLGLTDKADHALAPDHFMPAVAQGIICIETRAGDAITRGAVDAINDPAAEREAVAERAMLRVLDGSCRTPIACYSRAEGARFVLQGLVLSPDGLERYEAELSGKPEDAAALGHAVGERIRAAAGEAFFERLAAAMAAPGGSVR